MVMKTVTVSKRYYHLQEAMIKWLTDHYGSGKWYRSDVGIPQDEKWAWDCVFGTTTFYFGDDETCTYFALRWS